MYIYIYTYICIIIYMCIYIYIHKALIPLIRGKTSVERPGASGVRFVHGRPGAVRVGHEMGDPPTLTRLRIRTLNPKP